MSFLRPSSPAPVPVTPPGERSDCCGFRGTVAVVKQVLANVVELDHVAESGEQLRMPHAVVTKQAVLVFCTDHFRAHEPALTRDGWRVLPGGVR